MHHVIIYAYSLHIIHVIHLDDARSDVSQNMDADDELELNLSAVVIATTAKKRKKAMPGAIVLSAAVDLQSSSYWWI